MQIKIIHRPWIKRIQRRYNPDPYYQSNNWRILRSDFREDCTFVNGFQLSNKYCIDCFKESGSLIPGSNTDHIKPRKAGGLDIKSNLQTQCDRHHAIKSANEGKK